MIGLDTNIIVRYITGDDPRQSAIASEIFERRLSAAEPGFISTVAIAEVAWVLDRSYGFASEEIAAAIERLLQIDEIFIENEHQVYKALSALRARVGEFADALIGALNLQAGCSRTWTFDRHALRLEGFEHP